MGPRLDCVFGSWELSRILGGKSKTKMTITGSELTYNNQSANKAFSAFLMSLTFLNGLNLNKLFSSTTRERVLSDRSKRFDGTVMDETAMGILSTLPNFGTR